MKKLIFTLAILLFGMNSYAQNYGDIRYAYLEAKNTYGENFADFELTYDTTNNCYNNIQVFAEVPININYQVYIDGSRVYSGWVLLPASGTYYINNAFWHCQSSYEDIEIRVQGR